MAQRISPSVFDKVDTFFIAELSQVPHPHALKGQKPLAQCSALVNYGREPVALKGQKLSNTGQLTKLLPLQGALLIACIPRAMPWARSFCPLPFPSAGDRWFRACGAHLRKFWIIYVRKLLACIFLRRYPSGTFYLFT